MWKAEGGSHVLRSASHLLGAVSRILHGASHLLRVVSHVGSGFQAVSQCSAGRVGASGWFSTGYVEVSELTLITKMEGVWDHLGLGSGLGQKSDGIMMRMCDYDRLCCDGRDRPSTATPLTGQLCNQL